MEPQSKQRKISNKSLANLRPAKKGEVRNPNGRKNDCWRDIENKLLSASKIDFQIETIKDGHPIKMRIYVDIGSKESFRYALTARKIQMGLSGDIAAIKDLQDRDIGKAKESIDMTSGGEKMGATIINVISDNAAQEIKKIIND